MENHKNKQSFLKSRTRALRKNKECVKNQDEARTPPLVENENEPPSRQSTPSKARKPMSSVLSSIDTISFQTPVRKNTSTKFMANSDTAHLILKDICTNDTCHTHVIHGEPGIGKTWLMHQIAQLPLSKLHFKDGIVWIGISKCDSLRYSELIEIYHKIFEDLFRDKRKINDEDPKLDFSSILYMESKINIKTAEDKYDEKRAMLQARDIMSNLLGIKKSCLICIDGLQDRIDSQYFNFTTNQISSQSKSLVTYNGPTAPSSHIKIWTLSGLNDIDAKNMFFEKLSVKTTSHPNFQSKFTGIHLLSRGNPCILEALSCLINDKVGMDEAEKYLNEFSTKFANAPSDAQVQLAIITEAIFSHSSLGEKNSTIAFRCFVAFAVVFTQDECTRPFVPRAPVRVLFKAILDRADKSQNKDNDSRVDNIIEFLVNVKILTQADGFDDHATPQLFYQVSCDMHQEYAMSLNRECSSLNKILIEKCQSSFIERNYSSRCKEIDHYMLNYLPHHCMKANQFEETATILQDVRFIEDRIDHLGFIKACNNHIEDTEKLLISSRDANKKLDSKQIFAESYEYFVRSLETKAMGQTCDKESIVWCIWKLSFSLLQNHLIHKACAIIRRGMELQSDMDHKIIDLDEKLLKRVSDGKYDGSDNIGRALILFGTSLLQCSSMKIESYYLLKNGLNCLQTTLGDSNLEFARAQVYVGEIMYKDFKLYRKSLSLFQNALSIFNTRLGEESEEVTDLILLIGKSCLHAGELDTSLNIFRKIGPRLKGALALDIEIKVGYIYIVKNEFDRALQILSRAKKRTNDADVLDRIDKLMLQCGENDRCSV